jgi:uncharacterized glyoxalase superfamily protein PhnB
MMKPTPKGWPRLSTAVFYTDANLAIEWLSKAFGFEVRLKVDGEGLVQHSELVYGEAVIMVGDERVQRGKQRPFASPKSLGGKSTQSVMIYVDDVDAHCADARAAGAKITYEPSVSDYGEEYWADKTYQAEDHEGHLWWFAERVRG